MGREGRRQGVIPRKKEPLDYGCGCNYREMPGGEMQTEMQLQEEIMQTLECTRCGSLPARGAGATGRNHEG